MCPSPWPDAPEKVEKAVGREDGGYEENGCPADTAAAPAADWPVGLDSALGAPLQALTQAPRP
jgi:hypothetical protein